MRDGVKVRLEICMSEGELIGEKRKIIIINVENELR